MTNRWRPDKLFRTQGNDATPSQGIFFRSRQDPNRGTHEPNRSAHDPNRGSSSPPVATAAPGDHAVPAELPPVIPVQVTGYPAIDPVPGNAVGRPADEYVHVGSDIAPAELDAALQADHSAYQSRAQSQSGAQQRAARNVEVAKQIDYIAKGPFPDDLREELNQVILRYATSAQSLSSPEAHDAEMSMALKLSEQDQHGSGAAVGPKREILVLIMQVGHDTALQNKLHYIRPYFPHYRPIMGDGNCFYRGFACGLIEVMELMETEAYEHVHERLRYGYEQLREAVWVEPANQPILAQGYKVLAELMRQHSELSQHMPPIERELVRLHRVDDCIVVLMRHLTAFALLESPKHYSRFLAGIEGRVPLAPEQSLALETVVTELVLANGKYAEHLMIQALCTLMGACIAVVYTSGEAGGVKVHIIKPLGEGDDRPRDPWMFLLYRGTHYDVLYQYMNYGEDGETWRDLLQAQQLGG